MHKVVGEQTFVLKLKVSPLKEELLLFQNSILIESFGNKNNFVFHQAGFICYILYGSSSSADKLLQHTELQKRQNITILQLLQKLKSCE